MSGPFFGECKELNRAGPPKVMGLKKKLLLNIPTPTQKEIYTCFMFQFLSKKSTSLVKIIANFDFGG
jgi:hypothetical protein